jgi:hypothetical protein
MRRAVTSPLIVSRSHDGLRIIRGGEAISNKPEAQSKMFHLSNFQMFELLPFGVTIRRKWFIWT